MRPSERLRLTNEELEVILNSTHDGMVAVNASGIITVFNAAAGRLMRVDPEDMVGALGQGRYPQHQTPCCA